jgi:excisionase family DNA binding protein
MAVREIAQRLGVGRLAVYTMLEQGIIPSIRVGRRWIVTQAAYEEWERTCGFRRIAASSGHVSLATDGRL